MSVVSCFLLNITLFSVVIVYMIKQRCRPTTGLRWESQCQLKLQYCYTNQIQRIKKNRIMKAMSEEITSGEDLNS